MMGHMKMLIGSGDRNRNDVRRYLARGRQYRERYLNEDQLNLADML